MASIQPALAQDVPAGLMFTAAGAELPSGPFHVGALATDVHLEIPVAMLALPDGRLLVASDIDKIVLVDATGRIAPFAGSGRPGLGREGAPATQASFDDISDLALLPDGSVLVADADANTVREIALNGTIRTVAGRRADEYGGGYGGDGGPATAARLNHPVGLAVASDGSYLIADEHNERMRRVGSDGTITTLAGSGRAAHSGDGGPATLARLLDPVAVATQTDGSVLVAEGGSADGPRRFGPEAIRRIAPDGTISSLARLPAVDVVPLDDGLIAAVKLNPFNQAERLVHLTNDGRITPIAGSGGFSSAGLTNGTAPGAASLWMEQLAPTPDGGLLALDRFRIRYWAPGAPQRLAIGITAPTFATPLALHVTFALTVPSAVSADIIRRGRVVRHASLGAAAGENAIDIPGPVAPGSYDIRLTARSPETVPQQASDTIRVRPGGILTIGAAHQAVASDAADRQELGGGHWTVRCHRFGRRRSDCGERAFGLCQQILAVTLLKDGTLRGREYSDATPRCHFHRAPHWRGRPFALTP